MFPPASEKALEQLETPPPVHSRQTPRPRTDVDLVSVSLASSKKQSIISSDGASLEAAKAEIRPPLTKQRWNEPRENVKRIATCYLSIFNLGFNDASYGVLLPFLQLHYQLSYLHVSLIFVFVFIGYVASSLLNHRVHVDFGQRGIATIGPPLRIACYLVISFAPPFPVICAALAVAGLSIGLLDGAWNAWVGDLDNPSQLLGFMTAMYGVGAVISPLVATSMITTYGCSWNQFFYIPFGLCIVELAFGSWAFWSQNAEIFNAKMEASAAMVMSRRDSMTGLGGALRQKVTWIVAGFLFMYIGAEVSLAGWIPSFMYTIRDATYFNSGMSSTGFWLGITFGRITLGFITPRIGERLAVSIYLVLCVCFELLFWLVPGYLVGTVMVALLGVFMGPLWPAAIVAATKLLPKHLHVSGIAFASSIAGGGGAMMPFLTGIVANTSGVDKLQPIVLVTIVVMLGLWLLLPELVQLAEGSERQNTRSIAESPFQIV